MTYTIIQYTIHNYIYIHSFHDRLIANKDIKVFFEKAYSEQKFKIRNLTPFFLSTSLLLSNWKNFLSFSFFLVTNIIIMMMIISDT